jgi:hypothetical protein
MEMLMKDHLNEGTKHVLDGVSLLTVLGTLMSWLPAVAALLSIIWTVLRIYESKTVQDLLGKKDAEHK